jgi:hypothetical protein
MAVLLADVEVRTGGRRMIARWSFLLELAVRSQTPEPGTCHAGGRTGTSKRSLRKGAHRRPMVRGMGGRRRTPARKSIPMIRSTGRVQAGHAFGAQDGIDQEPAVVVVRDAQIENLAIGIRGLQDAFAPHHGTAPIQAERDHGIGLVQAGLQFRRALERQDVLHIAGGLCVGSEQLKLRLAHAGYRAPDMPTQQPAMARDTARARSPAWATLSGRNGRTPSAQGDGAGAEAPRKTTAWIHGPGRHPGG